MEYKEAFELTKKQRAALNALIDGEDCDRIREVLRKKTRKHCGPEDSSGELDVLGAVAEYAQPKSVDSPLQYAYKNKKYEALRTLLDCGLEPGEKMYYDSESLLELVIRENDLEWLQEILPSVGGCTGRDSFQLEQGRIDGTFLGYCAALGRVEAAKMLMSVGHRMVPMTTREALELDQDCIPVYNGKYYGKKDMRDFSNYLGTPIVTSIEPWQFALMGEATEAADFFLDFGKHTNSRSLRDMILQLEDEAMICKAEQKFPAAVEMLCGQTYAGRILEMGNVALLKRSRAEDWDLSLLCTDYKKNIPDNWADRAVDCYEVLKQKLDRPLSKKEKNWLVNLMLVLKSERLLEVCEKEWNGEEDGCDVTDLVREIPSGRQDEKQFTRALEQSSLRLTIRPDDSIFDACERMVGPYGYRGEMACMKNYRTLAILDRLVTVLPPENPSDEVLPFAKGALVAGRKSTFKRLQKWGLLHEKNMDAAIEFMAENGLSEYYDQAVHSGKDKKNRKTYEL